MPSVATLTVNPVASIPPLIPPAHWAVDEHHGPTANRAAVLVDVVPVLARRTTAARHLASLT
jgi:hypothetical protein